MVLRNLPLSEQVRTQILQWIQSGSLARAEGALPSEMEIAEMLNTSRATVREALAQLERDRYIIRKQGSGTYINPSVRHLTSTVADLLDPETFITSQGFNCTVCEYSCIKGCLTESESQALSQPVESDTLRVSILYHADSKPAIWLEAVIPPDPIINELPEIVAYIPLPHQVYKTTGSRTTHSITTIDAVNADKNISMKLGINIGCAVNLFLEVHLSDYGRPVFISHQYLSPGLFNLQLLRNSYRLSDRFSVW